MLLFTGKHKTLLIIFMILIILQNAVNHSNKPSFYVVLSI